MQNINWVVERYNASTSGWTADWQLRLILSWDAVIGSETYVVYYDGQEDDYTTSDTSVTLARATFIDNTWDTIRIVAKDSNGTELDSATVNVGYFKPEWFSEPSGNNTDGVTLEFVLKPVDFPLVIERNDTDWTRIGIATQQDDRLIFHDTNTTPDTTHYYRASYETEHYADMYREYLSENVYITELPLPPSDITLANNTISYADASEGSGIGPMVASDPNTYSNCQLSLPEGQDDNSLFELGYIFGDGYYLFPVTPPINAGEYVVTVRATDDTGLTFDKTFTIIISQSPLSSPTCYVEPQTTNILVTWDEIDNATGYDSVISDDGEHWSEPVTVTGTEYEYTDLASATLYYVRVRATNSSGNYTASDWSPVVSCTTLAPLAAPTDILLSNNTIAFADARPYTLIGTLVAIPPNEDDVVSFALLNQEGDNRYFIIEYEYLGSGDVGLEARQYTITVRATNSIGLTFDKTFTIDVIPSSPLSPHLPTSPQVSPTSSGFIVTWDTGDDPCSYELQYSPDGEDWGETVTVTGARYELSGLGHDVTRFFRVRRIASDGNSSDDDWLDIMSGTTLGPPPAPNATAISQHEISITWPSDTGPIRLERALFDTDEWIPLVVDCYESFYMDSTALPTQRYLYRIVSGTCCSAPDIAWLSTVVHYSVITQEGIATSEDVVWSYVTEMTV